MNKSAEATYVYIAGPMRGLPSYNFPAFYEAESAVRLDGLIAGKPVIVFNPAHNDVRRHGLWGMSPEAAGQWLLDNPQEFDLRVALGEDLEWISKFADVVVVLPGWKNSKGAKCEVALARALGIEVRAYDSVTGRLTVVPEDPPIPSPGQFLLGLFGEEDHQ